jgi:hypothetical protein
VRFLSLALGGLWSSRAPAVCTRLPTPTRRLGTAVGGLLQIFIVLELITGGELFDKIVSEGKYVAHLLT